MEFSIIIFCYNEGTSIERVIRQAAEVMRSCATRYELIVVNDGSTDQTGDVCRALAATLPQLRYVEHPANKGIGCALRTGYAAAQYQYVCAIPGDGQFDVALLCDVPAFGEKEFYCFYRRKTNYNAYRSILTWGNKAFNKLLLGISLRDVNWVKVYTRHQLERCDLQLSSSLVETEICSKLIHLGAVPVELPSDYLVRGGGTPKGGSIKTLYRALAETVSLIAELRRFRRRPQ